jgi:hypothetical protein
VPEQGTFFFKVEIIYNQTIFLIMKKNLLITLAIILVSNVFAQDYGNYSQITQRVRALKDKYPDKVQFKSLGKTDGGKDVWMITLGKGETEKHPAIAIVGGVDGRHLLGVEIAMGLAERILTQPNADEVLAANTYYFYNTHNRRRKINTTSCISYYFTVHFHIVGSAQNVQR